MIVLQTWLQWATHPGFHESRGLGEPAVVYRWLDHPMWLVLPAVLLTLDAAGVVVWLVTGTWGWWLWLLLAMNGFALPPLVRRYTGSTRVADLGDTVLIRTGPLYRPRNLQVRRCDIAGLEIRTHGAQGSANRHSYSLHLVRTNGETVWLLKGLSGMRRAIIARKGVAELLNLEVED